MMCIAGYIPLVEITYQYTRLLKVQGWNSELFSLLSKIDNSWQLGMDIFHFFSEKLSFRFKKTNKEKQKTNRPFLKTRVFEKYRIFCKEMKSFFQPVISLTKKGSF